MSTPNPRHGIHGATGFSPACDARQQEKEDLSNLNDRLAVYIDKVRSLESENTKLRSQIEETQTIHQSSMKGIKEHYEEELDDVRSSLDRVTMGRARLELELDKLRQEHMELKARNSEKEADLETTRTRLKDMEAVLNSKEALLITLSGEKRSLEAELKDFRAQVAKLNKNLADTTKQLQDEILRKFAAENRHQTLTEELEFQKNLYSKEVDNLERRIETTKKEKINEYERKYENKLAEAISELRAEHEEKFLLYKQEIEETYHSKLEDARKEAERCNNRMGATYEELQQTREKMKRQISELQKQVRDLEDAVSRDQALKEENEREIRDVKAKMQKREEEFQRLCDIKLSLDVELNNYKKMLEGEEERLHLSPKGSPAKRARTPQSSYSSPLFHSAATPSSSRKYGTSSSKKCHFSSNDGKTSGIAGGSVTKTHIKQSASASGRITVDEVDLNGKFIRLSNNTDEDQDMGRWCLKRQVESSSPIEFKFPKEFTLKSQGTVTIWAASGGGTHNPPTDLVCRSHQSWGTGKRLYTTLINDKGEEKAKRSVTRVLVFDNDGDVVNGDDDMETSSTHSSESPYNLRSRTTITEREARLDKGPSDDLEGDY